MSARSLSKHVPRIDQAAGHDLDRLAEAGATVHRITAAYWVGGHHFCDCSCGETAELFDGVKPFCHAGAVEEDFAETLADLRRRLTRARHERDRRLDLARRDALRDHARLYRLLHRTA